MQSGIFSDMSDIRAVIPAPITDTDHSSLPGPLHRRPKILQPIRSIAMRRNTLMLISVVSICGCVSQPHGQVADKSYRPPIEKPAYAKGTGPVVCLDEAHFNFHTLDGRFWAFGELAKRDGFIVRASRRAFDEGMLDECDILVISNAQPSDAEWDTYPYPTPSAFTREEISVVHRWVEEGGRLLLIADHMPLAGAASELAAAFDVKFNDGFAMPDSENASELENPKPQPVTFQTADGTLRPHAIVHGRSDEQPIASVRSFVGQAFQAPRSAEPILVLPRNFVSLMPEKAWEFSAETKRLPVDGWLQGAVMKVGGGRAAFFGEAAMFSAQRVGTTEVGMNAPGAEENYRLVLNVLRWLSGALEASPENSAVPVDHGVLTTR